MRLAVATGIKRRVGRFACFLAPSARCLTWAKAEHTRFRHPLVEIVRFGRRFHQGELHFWPVPFFTNRPIPVGALLSAACVLLAGRRQLALELPRSICHWSLTTLEEKLVKIGVTLDGES